jgi:hypothetical protein
MPYKLPTTLLHAIAIDSLLGNNDWRVAYDVEVHTLLLNGNQLPLHSTPLFQIKLNGTHKVNLGLVVPFNSTSDDQNKPNIAFVDCPPFYDAYLLNDRSSLASPSDATYCLPCIDQYPSPSSVKCFLQSFDVLAQSRMLSTLLPSVTISSSYKLISNSDPQYHVILLEARRLQLNLSNYDD